MKMIFNDINLKMCYISCMSLSKLEKYYNKFNEDKRLISRHGIIEFTTTTKYIDMLLETIKKDLSISDNSQIKIADIGAGTGRYSKHYFDKGYDVTSVELVKQNFVRIKEKCPNIKAYLKDARNLKGLESESFDITLLLGPMYHLFDEDKLVALNEAKRITKKGGYIVIAYLLNDYAVISYAFKENKLKEVVEQNKLDSDYITHTTSDDLYSYDTLEKIYSYSNSCELLRYKILSPDGPTDYMRQVINNMDEYTFSHYLQYVQKIAERQDLLGASSHIVDILIKQ